MNAASRVAKLRELMKAQGIHTAIITKNDPHQSEDSPEFWNSVEFISGFTGSNGLVVVTMDKAGLWTDGRYYIQAEKQLAGSGIALYKAPEPETIDFLTFARNETPEGGKIAVDGRTVSMADGRKLLKLSKTKKITVVTELDFPGEIWADRPSLSMSPVYDYDVCFCGKDRRAKLAEVRAKMAEDGADVFVLSATDDIAWLFNLRGNDLDIHTTFASFAVIEKERATVFIHDEKAADVKDILAADGVDTRHYDDIYPFLSGLDASCGQIALEAQNTCMSIYQAVSGCDPEEIDVNYTTSLKAIKNDTELKNLENVNVRDGVAMVRFIKWMKENAASGEIDEADAGEKLRELRAEGENFVFPSFNTIAAYMANAAMMHYSAEKESCAAIKAEGMLLVDSGGHYLDGSTDMTRTIILGGISPEMKKDFTLTLKSHIRLARTIFLYGATGSHLDVIARKVMWDNGMNYKCGTGHGLGFFLNVHEGPQSIGMRPNNTRLEEGMVLTNEPGVYKENRYGIRTENTMKVVFHAETADGKFLAFSVFSYCPIDLNGVDPALLDDEELKWLNDYHQMVYDKLSPHLTEDESKWLRCETSAISRWT